MRVNVQNSVLQETMAAEALCTRDMCKRDLGPRDLGPRDLGINDLGAISLTNRPHGNLAFEKEIDQVFLWLQMWNLNQVMIEVFRYRKPVR